MRTFFLAASAASLLLLGCRQASGDHARSNVPPASYYDNRGHSDAWSGGARKITISTPKGPHQIWIKRDRQQSAP